MILTFDKNTGKSRYDRLFTLDVGQVIRVEDDDYETVMQRIEEYLPAERSFEVFPITPGTDLYTMHGPSHCVVVKNEIVTD